MNINKTEGIWLGHLKVSGPDCFCEIYFKYNPIKCLGIYIGHNKNMCFSLNWDKKLEFFDNLLERWKARDLSIFGKVVVVNTLAVHKLLYNFTVLHVPKCIVDHVEEKIIHFIWPNGSKININCIINL